MMHGLLELLLMMKGRDWEGLPPKAVDVGAVVLVHDVMAVAVVVGVVKVSASNSVGDSIAVMIVRKSRWMNSVPMGVTVVAVMTHDTKK